MSIYKDKKFMEPKEPDAYQGTGKQVAWVLAIGVGAWIVYSIIMELSVAIQPIAEVVQR